MERILRREERESFVLTLAQNIYIYIYGLRSIKEEAGEQKVG